MTASKTVQPFSLAIVSVCAALNLGVGFVVAALKLPFYLDSIGTLIATAIGGPIVGILTGIVTVLVGSIYTPTLWAYAPVAVVIALYAHLVMRFGYLRRIVPTILFGILLGVVSATVAAPITTFVWSGVSLAGTDAATAFFAAMGNTLLESVLYGGLSADPVDKLFTSVVAMLLLQRVPSRWFDRAHR